MAQHWSMAVTLSTVAKSGCQWSLGKSLVIYARSCLRVCVRRWLPFMLRFSLCTFAASFLPLVAVSTCALSDGLVVTIAVAWPMLQHVFPALRCLFFWFGLFSGSSVLYVHHV